MLFLRFDFGLGNLSLMENDPENNLVAVRTVGFAPAVQSYSHSDVDVSTKTQYYIF